MLPQQTFQIVNRLQNNVYSMGDQQGTPARLHLLHQHHALNLANKYKPNTDVFCLIRLAEERSPIDEIFLSFP